MRGADLSVQIRPGRPKDVASVRDIVERAYGIYVEQIGGRPAPMDADYEEVVRRGHLFVAEDEGVVGLIVLVLEPDHVLIENVAVDPGRQSVGVGRLLLAHAEAYARTHSIPTLRLYTNAAMTRNLALYARLGYSEDHRRTDGGFERVFLSKRLDSGTASM